MLARAWVAVWLLLAVAATGCRHREIVTDPAAAPLSSAAKSPVLFNRYPVPPPAIPTPRGSSHYELHGDRISDPYLWLEDGDSPIVTAWVQAQNQLVEATLGRLPVRDVLRARLEHWLSIGSISLPTARRSAAGTMRYFYSRRDGDQDQAVLVLRDGASGKEQVLVDPNRLSRSAQVSLDWYYPSWDGRLVAYGLSRDGSEQSVLHILSVDTRSSLSDRITRTRHCSLCWKPDGSGFFYSRLAAPGEVPAGVENYQRLIYEHVLGRSPERDPVVFGLGRSPTEYPGCALAPGGRWLVVRTNTGWNKSELFLADTTAPRLEFSRITTGLDHLYDPLVLDDRLYVTTNEQAPRYAVFAVDPNRPHRDAWTQVVPEHPHDVLVDMAVVGGQLLTTYLHDGVSRLERFDASGRSQGQIPMPGVGTSDGFTGLHDGAEAFFNFESFVVPTRILRVDLNHQRIDTFAEVPSPIAPDEYTVTRATARSADGTRIPFLVVRRRGSDATGRAPTLLTGYGGFNVNVVPRFSRTGMVWLERGGVAVQAVLRGGGEYGEAWHRAGQLGHKQNCFDDFVAVAEQLIADRVTTSDRLAILGRSNGGLLVAAALTQRPDLFRAAVAGVPLTDMLRYHRFLLGELWTPEFGSPDDPAQYQWLRAYSPYHRVRTATPYPAVLLLTADSDTRVDPLHARKFAAALQHASSSGRPVLLRTELSAGHGAGKPASRIAAETADVYAFVLWQLGELDE